MGERPRLAYDGRALDCLIRFLPSQRSIRAPTGTNLLEAARLAGLLLADDGCGGWGTCSRCVVRIVEGGEGVAAESEGEKEAKRSNGIEQDLRLACFISLEQDLTVTILGWEADRSAAPLFGA
jgi:adenylate cyclase